MNKKRIRHEQMRQNIIETATLMAAESHYMMITRQAVADVIGVSGPAVTYHMRTMHALRVAVLQHAIKSECLEVVAQGLLWGDPTAKDAPAAIRVRASKLLG